MSETDAQREQNQRLFLEFDRELRSLEDFLADHQHTLESFTETVFSSVENPSSLESSKFDIQRKIRSMYRMRDLFQAQTFQAPLPSQATTASRLRRLQRI